MRVADEFSEVDRELLRRGFTRMVFERARIETLLDLLGNPQRAYPSIHITGTNGKSSTARTVDSLLRAHGLRTGRYTSPHLASVRERISLDGEPVSEDRFVRIYREVEPLAALVDKRYDEPLTYFDITTAMAFAAFADAPVDVAVVEVGLGGETDSTNVLAAPVCVLTPIGLDHTEWLGDTIEDIAWMKLGIVHRGVTLVSAAQPDEAAHPILNHCAEMDATLAREGSEFGVLRRSLAVGGQELGLQGLSGAYEGVFLPLHGAHQAQNAAVALAAVEAFFGAGPNRQLDLDTVRDGFGSVTVPGRLERVRSSPAVLLDAAHNPAGMAATAAALVEEFSFRRLVGVVAFLADKDVSGMLEQLEPVLDALVVTRNSSSRGMSLDDLAPLARQVFGDERVTVAPDLLEAVDAAVSLAEAERGVALSGAGVVVTGSVITVADARRMFFQ